MVVISSPSAWTASTEQLFADTPFSSTVQAPQLEVSQPMGVPDAARHLAYVMHEQHAGLDVIVVPHAVDSHADLGHPASSPTTLG